MVIPSMCDMNLLILHPYDKKIDLSTIDMVNYIKKEKYVNTSKLLHNISTDIIEFLIGTIDKETCFSSNVFGKMSASKQSVKRAKKI